MNTIVFILLLVLIGCDGGSSDNEIYTKTIFINSSLVECVGVGPQKCMQIKEYENDDWELFYDEIEGFEFEEGFTYEIMVEIIDIDDPPADASSEKWILVEIISKEEV